VTRRNLHALATLLLLLALPGTVLAEPAGEQREEPDSLLRLEARRLGGGTESLDRYRGQEALYDRYRSQGFSVLGFPSNDFGGQEPGSDPEIGAFCRSNYGVEFPMFSKVRVKGPDVHPVYAYLTSLPEPLGGAVQWNFQKYLVDRNGKVVARYASRVTPADPGLVAEVERLLAEPRPESPRAGLAR
jgi:glutathione peroxidase